MTNNLETESHVLKDTKKATQRNMDGIFIVVRNGEQSIQVGSVDDAVQEFLKGAQDVHWMDRITALTKLTQESISEKLAKKLVSWGVFKHQQLT